VRKRALLALSLPLAAAGSLAGHAAGYALVGMSSRDARIHGYLGYAPQFLALCTALVALALALRFAGRLQGRPSAWPFALLPPVAFAAYLAARALLRGADAVARTLTPRPAFTLRPVLLPVPAAVPALTRTQLAFDRLGRAPPRR
jgi:hypothetical protein